MVNFARAAVAFAGVWEAARVFAGRVGSLAAARVKRRQRKRDMMRHLMTLCLLLVAATASAKPLYVSTSGNDDTTYAANSETTPWRSIGRAVWGSTSRTAPNAAEAAKAGDVVTVAPGIYSTAGTDRRFEAAYDPINNGTAGALLVVQCATARACRLQLNASRGPVIGCAGSNYVKWDGFLIDEATAAPRPDTGPVVFNASIGCELHNTEVRGIVTGFNDNHNAVRVEGAQFTRLQGNTLSGIGDGGGYGQNSAAVMLYDSNDTTIEENHLRDSGVGVFVKGQHPGVTQRRTVTRRNLITGMRYAGINTLADFAGRHSQNIIRGCVGNGVGIKVYSLGPGEGGEPTDTKFVNNTIDGCVQGIELQGTGRGVEFINNLFTNHGTALGAEGTITPPLTGLISFVRNGYFGNGTLARFDRDGSGQNLTFAQWQTSYGQDAHGSTANPLYVGGGDFHLQPTSPVRQSGRAAYGIGGPDDTVVPLGAYITGDEQIGPGGSAPPPPPPPAPVDCVGTWGAWTRIAGSETACVAGSRTFTESRLFTVITSPANGGTACPASPESRTSAEACTMPPPPPPPADPVIRLDCTAITSVVRGADYANGDQRWTVRGQCVAPVAGAVRGPGR